MVPKLRVKTPVKQRPRDPGSRRCDACGHIISAGDKFCTGCGKPIGKAAPQKQKQRLKTKTKLAAPRMKKRKAKTKPPRLRRPKPKTITVPTMSEQEQKQDLESVPEPGYCGSCWKRVPHATYLICPYCGNKGLKLCRHWDGKLYRTKDCIRYYGPGSPWP